MTSISCNAASFLQAYGAGSYKALGLVLQRALLITWFTCLPIMLLWAHSESLMLALGQQPAIAAGAARYVFDQSASAALAYAAAVSLGA